MKWSTLEVGLAGIETGPAQLCRDRAMSRARNAGKSVLFLPNILQTSSEKHGKRSSSPTSPTKPTTCLVNNG